MANEFKARNGIITPVVSSTVATGTAPLTVVSTTAVANLSIGGNAAGLSQTLNVSSGGTGLGTLTTQGVLLGNGTGTLISVAPGTSGNVLTSDGTTWKSSTLTGGGEITSVSIASANGFSGTVNVTTPTTPIISIGTSITGLLKGNGTNVVSAVSGTDYVIPSGTVADVAGGGVGTLLYQSAANTTAMLAAGSSGYILIGSGAVPVWQLPTLEKTAQTAWVKNNVLAATTADVAAVSSTATTLTGGLVVFPAQDGITIGASNRILVKDQTNAAQNGIYQLTTVGVLGTTAWVLSRTTDTSVVAYGAGAVVAVNSGTVNGGFLFDCDLKSTDTLGTTLINWSRVVDSSYLTSWIGSSNIANVGIVTTGTWRANTVNVAYGGTGSTTLTANGILVGNGTGTLISIAPGTSGYVLTSNGTNWYSAPSAGGGGSMTYPPAGIANSTGTAWSTSYTTSGTGTVLALTTGSSLTTPSLSGETYSTNPGVSAAGTTQGTGTALTNDYNVITTAASGTGVVLPTATVGRRIIIINKGLNALAVYPATSGFIDALSINASISIPVAGWMEFNASSTTQWYSSYNITSASSSPTATATYTRTSFTATAGQINFTVTYTVGYAEVFLNGVLLNSTDYTASSGTTIALTLAAVLNDIVEVIAYNVAIVSVTDASSLATGTVPVARLGSGTANSTTFLKGDNTWVIPTLMDLPGAWVKKAVICATTANIALSATQTIDTIAVVAGNRVLVKNQTTASQNGIYVVAAGAWTRDIDADISGEAAGATTSIDSGTQAGQIWSTSFIPSNVIGTTAMNWYRIMDTTMSAPLAISLSGGVLGSIPYQSAANTTAMTAAGTTGQVLTTVTTGAAPTWETPAAGGGGTSLGVSFAIYNNMNIF
jgi:hypothetical protein